MIDKMIRGFIVIVIILLGYSASFAQLTFSPISLKQLDAAVCWNVRVQLNGTEERVELQGKVYDDGGSLLIECMSEKLFLRNGINALDAGSVRTANIRIFDTGVKKHLERYGVLPAGRYRFCTQALSASDNGDLGQDCITLTQIGVRDGAANKGRRASKYVETFGQAGVEHIYANRQGSNQQIPPHLLRAYAQPNLTLATLPFSANLFYTTERNVLLPDQYALSFQFDANRFKENLRTLVETKILESSKISLANEQNRLRKIAELESLGEQLKSLKAPDNLEISALETEIKNTGTDEIPALLESLNQQTQQALQSIDYENQKQQLTESNNRLSEIVPQDTSEERQVSALRDTIDSRLKRLESRKDSVLNRLEGFAEKRRLLQEKKQKINDLQQQLDRAKQLAGQFSEMEQKRTELAQLTQLTSRLGSPSEEILRLSDPQILRQNLVERGMFSGLNKLMFGVRQLSIGTVYPVFSPLTFNGIQVQGGALEINPGLFYLNITGGNTRLGSQSMSDVFENTYKRWVVAARLGVGRMESSHLIFSFMHASDREGSIPESFANILRPTENNVLSAQSQLSFWKRRIRLQGEAAACSYNRNQADSSLNVFVPEISQIPDFLKPSLSTSYDIAYTIRSELNLWKGSVINAFTEYIGPGYTSLGVPFLRNDVMRYGGRIEQQLFNTGLKLHLRYRHENDNLIQSKRATSTMTFATAGIAYSKSKKPSLRFEYSQNSRNSEAGIQDIIIASLNSGYSYKVRSMNLRTGLNLQQLSSSNDSLNIGDYSQRSVMATQSIALRKPITILASLGYNRLESTLQNQNQLLLGGGFTAAPGANFSIGLNADFAQNAEQDERFGIQTDINYMMFKNMVFSLSARLNRYQNPGVSETSFTEMFITSKLAVIW